MSGGRGRSVAGPVSRTRDTCMIIILVLVVSVCLTALLVSLSQRGTATSGSDLTGPKPLPVLGNLLEIDPDALCESLHRLSLRYGKVYRIALPASDFIVIADPELYREILSTDWEVWDRDERPRQVASDFIGGLVLIPNAHWRHNRELFRGFFTPESQKRMQLVIHERVDKLLTRLDALAERGKPFDAQPLFQALTLDVIGCAAFGFDFRCLDNVDSPYREAFEGCMAHVMHRLVSPLPYWRWIRTSGVRTYEGNLRLLQTVVRQRLAHYRASPHSDESLLAHVVRAEKQGALSGWLEQADDHGLVVQMLTMLSAGHDTATGALSWLVYLLTARADLQVHRCLQEELDAEGVVTSRFDPDSTPLPWLTACLKETLRLRPSVAADGRQLRGTRELRWIDSQGRVCRHTCSAGQVVLLSPYVTHHQADLWPDPLEFRPHRFLPTAALPPHPFAYVPFGGGPRRCIGERFALSQLKIAAARMFQQFRLKLAPGYPQVQLRHAVNLRLKPALMMLAYRRTSSQ